MKTSERFELLFDNEKKRSKQLRSEWTTDGYERVALPELWSVIYSLGLKQE